MSGGFTSHPAEHCNRSNQRVRFSVCKSAAERVGAMEQIFFIILHF